MLKICHISDTHMQVLPIEDADILVHSGDFLNYGSMEELIQFRIELEKVKDRFDKIILIAGNHDRIFETNPYIAKQFLLETIPNLVYLYHESYTYKEYKIFGTPWQPYFCDWAFNVKDNLKLYEMYLEIPDDVNILITHCPPEGILDNTVNKWNLEKTSCGSRALKLALPRLKYLKVHMFGHIHFSNGIDFINNIWYSNSSICGEDYKPTNLPRIIELA